MKIRMLFLGLAVTLTACTSSGQPAIAPSVATSTRVSLPANTGASAPVAGEVQVPLEDPAQNHVSPPQKVTYRDNPPASGSHYPSLTAYGFHSEPVQTEYWVHNLEHGGVVILYNCPQACPELEQNLQQFYSDAPQSKRFHQTKIVIAPYPGLKTQMMAIAWGWQLALDSFDHDRLLDFYNRHLDSGPELAP